MTAKIIDGKAYAQNVKNELKEKVSKLTDKPGLAVVLVGEDSGSKVYVAGKEKDAQEVGFYSEIYRLPESTGQDEIIKLVNKLNNNPKIHGVLVQLPLPGHLDETLITNTIFPQKDVDGFTYNSAGRLLTGSPCLAACTPKGCIGLIKTTGVDIKGKNAVVIGRSNIVGKPMAILLLAEHATVTICHSKTKDLKSFTKNADILVAAIGKPKFVTADMVKEGAIVIDVGMDRDEKGKLCGDVDFNGVKEKASFITPVPGGVGPVTRAILMQNTFEAYQLQKTRQ